MEVRLFGYQLDGTCVCRLGIVETSLGLQGGADVVVCTRVVGTEFQYSPTDNFRFAEAPLCVEEVCEPDLGLNVFRRELARATIGRLGLAKPVLALECRAKSVVSGGIVGCQLESPPVGGLGIGVPVCVQEEVAERQVTAGLIR